MWSSKFRGKTAREELGPKLRSVTRQTSPSCRLSAELWTTKLRTEHRLRGSGVQDPRGSLHSRWIVTFLPLNGKGKAFPWKYSFTPPLVLQPLKKVPYAIVVVQSLSRVWLFVTPWTAACQVSQSYTISQSLLKLMPLSQWCHPTISSSVVPFSPCLNSLPASESFHMIRLFASDGQSIGASASASVLPMNYQGWFSLGLTGLISWLSKELSRVCSSTTVQSHRFFGAQPFLLSSSHICTWLLEKPYRKYRPL